MISFWNPCILHHEDTAAAHSFVFHIIINFLTTNDYVCISFSALGGVNAFLVVTDSQHR